jgi:hypothetical protein
MRGGVHRTFKLGWFTSFYLIWMCGNMSWQKTDRQIDRPADTQTSDIQDRSGSERDRHRARPREDWDRSQCRPPSLNQIAQACGGWLMADHKFDRGPLRRENQQKALQPLRPGRPPGTRTRHLPPVRETEWAINPRDIGPLAEAN